MLCHRTTILKLVLGILNKSRERSRRFQEINDINEVKMARFLNKV